MAGPGRGRLRGRSPAPPPKAFNRPISPIFHFFRLSWETSAQENLAPEASDRPETRLELLTRLSSIRFFPHFLISSRIKQGTQLITSPSTDDYWVSEPSCTLVNLREPS